MPTSTGRIASLPYTRLNKKCHVSSFVVVRADQGNPGKSSIHAPLSASKDYCFYSFEHYPVGDSARPLICGLNTAENLVCIPNPVQYSRRATVELSSIVGYQCPWHSEPGDDIPRNERLNLLICY